MHKNKVDFQLQVRIRSYLEYIWKEEQEMNDEEVTLIIGKLSSILQDELQYQIRGNILQQCKVISSNFSQGLSKKLVNIMEEVRFSPEEQIITINQVDDNSLYFITNGEVDIQFEGVNHEGEKLKKNILKTLQKGEVFGEISFFSGNTRSASAFSRGFSKVYKIQRQSFLNLLSQFPEDFEKFHYVRDSALQYNDYSQLKMKCYSCKKNNHLIQYCHVVHYKPDHERIIKKENYPHLNIRKFQKRKSRRISTKTCAQLVYHRAKDFQAETLFEQAQKNITDFDNNSVQSNLGPVQEEAYEDNDYEDVASKLDSEINSVIKNNDLRRMTRSLSRMSQISQNNPKLEIDNDPITDGQSDDLNNFFRKTEMKLTSSTAGFGMQESMKMQKKMTRFQESIMESDESSDEKNSIQSNQKGSYHSRSQQHIPLPAQLSNIPSPINGSKSSLFQQVTSQTPLIKLGHFRKLTNNDETGASYDQQNSSISLSNNQKKLQNQQNLKVQANQKETPSHRSQQDFMEVNPDNQNRSKNRRLSNNTRVSNNKLDSSYHECSTNVQPLIGFEKMQMFETYFPLNNFDIVLRKFSRVQKFFGKKRIFKDTSDYSYYFVAIKKGARLRRYLDKSYSVVDNKQKYISGESKLPSQPTNSKGQLSPDRRRQTKRLTQIGLRNPSSKFIQIQQDGFVQ